MEPKLRVVVADDSPFTCRLLRSHLESVSDIEVVGTAHSGEQACELVESLRPDALTLDLDMPGMSGLEVLDRLMHECPVPVVVVSGVSRRAAATALRALDMGAVDFVLKYKPGERTDQDELERQIVSKVRQAAGVKVVRSVRPLPPSWSEESPARAPRTELLGSDSDSLVSTPTGGVVVIGASTGGPSALRQLLTELPHDFPASVIVVQHMPERLTPVLVDHLGGASRLSVKQAAEGDVLAPGVVYVAPSDFHLRVGRDGRVHLDSGPAVEGNRPSVDVTMTSVARAYGERGRGVVLTGMGGDGAEGVRALKASGGRTFAQDGASAVIDGMPLRAVETGAVDDVGSPAAIGRRLAREVR